MFETAGLMKSLRDAMHARAAEGRVPADSDAKIEPGQRIAGPLRAGAAVHGDPHRGPRLGLARQGQNPSVRIDRAQGARKHERHVVIDAEAPGIFAD